ncbi:MAG: pyrroline-5-carboxylate reductase [Clostridia bacterium]|nr:pyrroline-5-carboxylate reductase [Clostridia bacterium]
MATIKVGFIGCGNMGGALARAAAKCADASVLLYDKDESKASSLAKEISATVKDSKELAGVCDLLFLGVKPNIIPLAAEEIKASLSPNTTVVSMAAGVRLSDLSTMLGTNNIIRIMPNTPAAVGMGMILYSVLDGVSNSAKDAFVASMANAGVLYELEEEKIDAGTAVSGCGPAFVYMFIDAMIAGGVAAGLTNEEARTLAAVTAKGAAEMVLRDPREPDELRAAVCSPGGSTIEGVKVLWDRDLGDAVKAAVDASYKRTKELGK